MALYSQKANSNSPYNNGAEVFYLLGSYLFDDLISNSQFAYLVYNVVNFREYKLENFIKKLEEIFTVTTSEDLENIVLYSKK